MGAGVATVNEVEGLLRVIAAIALGEPARRAPQAIVARPRPAVCRVCGRPWVDGECSFMPSQHARWGPVAR